MTDLEKLELSLRRVAEKIEPRSDPLHGAIDRAFAYWFHQLADQIAVDDVARQAQEKRREQRENQREAKAKAAIRTTSSSD